MQIISSQISQVYGRWANPSNLVKLSEKNYLHFQAQRNIDLQGEVNFPKKTLS